MFVGTLLKFKGRYALIYNLLKQLKPASPVKDMTSNFIFKVITKSAYLLFRNLCKHYFFKKSGI